MTVRASARHGRLVEPGGLASLRLALALARDPLLGDLEAHLAFRSLPRQRSTGAAAAAAPAVEAVETERTSVATIPTPMPPSEPTGELATVMDIVTRAQQGDADAFGELYDRYVDVVYRYVQYRVSSTALAEDLTSETFLRALRRITSYTWQGRDFGAWLVTIARNLIADHYKSGRYRLEVAPSGHVEAGADRTEDSPEGEVLASLTNETLLDAVKQLNGEQQECIALRFLQGMSVAETAQIMGKNEGAIKALQYRAVKSLARLLPQDLMCPALPWPVRNLSPNGPSLPTHLARWASWTDMSERVEVQGGADDEPDRRRTPRRALRAAAGQRRTHRRSRGRPDRGAGERPSRRPADGWPAPGVP
jgi:RNA polymerase sigma-70 factor (ECF subfamily)